MVVESEVLKAQNCALSKFSLPVHCNEDFRRRLMEAEKECAFENITDEELLISNFMTAITDKKLGYKLLNEKKNEMKKAIGLIKQSTYEKEWQSTKTDA